VVDVADDDDVPCVSVNNNELNIGKFSTGGGYVAIYNIMINLFYTLIYI
jgi:hypothetical protein